MVFIVAFLIPSIPVEGADHEWVATDYEGSCRQIGFKIHNDSIQVAENSTFSFAFFFRQLPENSGLVGNLIEHEAETTNNHVSVLSFVSERVGNIWKIEVDWLFSPCAQRFVGPTYHASFQLELMAGAS